WRSWSRGCWVARSRRTTSTVVPRSCSCLVPSSSAALEDARPLIPVITGPTGIGKTAVASALAALAPIEIISADSRQVYRGLDIGTAKPGAADRAVAPYHGLDLIEPVERYSA